MDKRTVARGLLLATLGCVLAGRAANAQFMALRTPFEQFTDYRLTIGWGVSSPPNSQWDEFSHSTVGIVKKQINFNQYIAMEYGEFRFGLMSYVFPSDMLPFIDWNPQFQIGRFAVGGNTSRFDLSIRAENLFAKRDANEYIGDGQSDKSIYPDRNSLSFLLTYWFGHTPNMNDYGALLREAAAENITPEVTPTGLVFPRSASEIRYSTRDGLSVGIGLGNGKYSGSGPISRYLNFFNSYNVYTDKGIPGFNPLALVRYRIRNLIMQFDVAGDDVDFGIILRNLKHFDIETGLLRLEHLFPRSSRGPHRPEAYLSLTYALSLGKEHGSFEYGDAVLSDTLLDELASNLNGLGAQARQYHANANVEDTSGDALAVGNAVLAKPPREDTGGDALAVGNGVKKAPAKPAQEHNLGDALTTGGGEMKLYTDSLDKNGSDGLTEGEQVPFVIGHRIANLPRIEFETGKWNILPQSFPTLNMMLAFMQKYPGTRISIQGHTDNQGDSIANQRLSLNRANSVRDWLIQHGISASRFETRGYGQMRPIATNSTPEGRKTNRRIEFIIIANDTQKKQ